MLELFIKSGYRLTGAESRELDKFGNAKIFLNNFVGVIENGFLKSVWGTQTDITERRYAEELIIDSEEKYRTLFQESQDAILLTTPDGNLIDINQAGIDLFGYSSRDEMLKLKDAGISILMTVIYLPGIWNNLNLSKIWKLPYGGKMEREDLFSKMLLPSSIMKEIH